MPRTVGMNSLINHLVKPLLGMGLTIGLGVLGVVGTVSPVEASQEVGDVKISAFRCFPNSNTCTLTINKDHGTSPGTRACVKRTFAWNKKTRPLVLDRVNVAYYRRRSVKLRYSDRQCYDARRDGGRIYGKLYMALEDLWLQ
ncbi:hypothetical protein ACN4EG_15855 [Alkalinema pantanalense CENA528]|uniref:hypothetical protein n=1 Tax=Alkalinema pantanalense TaxID=1620705 RepID=UPI003D6E096E